MTDSESSRIDAWFTGRLPDQWATAAPPAVTVDREEITVTITLGEPPEPDVSDVEVAEAVEGRIAGFREETREQRIEIAREAEHRFGRTVSWAVTVGSRTELFTHLAAPVMTRLRQPERQVLDTLVRANVARSRADALAWCVRLVGENTDDWLSELRDALRGVDAVRESGPNAA